MFHKSDEQYLYWLIQIDLSKANNCGEFSVTRGYWDYCLYKDDVQNDYLASSWEEKVESLMERVRNSDSPSGKGFDVEGI